MIEGILHPKLQTIFDFVIHLENVKLGERLNFVLTML